MYSISDNQIDYILSDISARGVEMESLQQNLLDHICCIIEQNLDEQGDFENFYQKTIKTFYKDALWEIEEETISLLTFKNYYVMKKTMIVSGTISAIGMSLGILFKFMHWPGASVFLLVGIFSASFIFLPLLFTLKAKEKQTTKDKMVLALGALCASLLSLSILFKIMHWPYANIMGMSALVMALVLFLPVYFFSGIRNEDSKVNTIASSVVIILGCGLIFTMMRTPQVSKLMQIRDTHDFARNEQILKTERDQVYKQLSKDSTLFNSLKLSKKINGLCEDLKSYILKDETGQTTLDENFESKDIFLPDNSVRANAFEGSAEANEMLIALIAAVNEYNNGLPASATGIKSIPTRASILEYYSDKNYGLITIVGSLNQLTQIQMFVLQNERELLATK